MVQFTKLFLFKGKTDETFIFGRSELQADKKPEKREVFLSEFKLLGFY